MGSGESGKLGTVLLVLAATAAEWNGSAGGGCCEDEELAALPGVAPATCCSRRVRTACGDSECDSECNSTCDGLSRARAASSERSSFFADGDSPMLSADSLSGERAIGRRKGKKNVLEWRGTGCTFKVDIDQRMVRVGHKRA